jgi:hypothetical protein
LLALSGCAAAAAGPGIAQHAVQDGFRLFSLRNAKVAVWPVPSASLDVRWAGLLAEAHTTQPRLLDDLGRSFSKSLAKWCRRGSLGTDDVVKLLTATPGLARYLDPEVLPGPAAPNRFVAAAVPDLDPLVAVEPLREIRYAVALGKLDLGGHTAITVFGTTAGGVLGTDLASARLRITVVDLEARRVVWDGTISTELRERFDATWTFEAIQEDLVATFLEQLGVER